ncbi:MAG: hypothetical protein ACTS6P_01225 [Candidatus Hodgkinia cicadicola]
MCLIPVPPFQGRNNLRWRTIISIFLSQTTSNATCKAFYLRSRTSGSFNNVPAELATDLNPSSCPLTLGTWQLPITLVSNTLTFQRNPSVATILSHYFRLYSI